MTKLQECLAANMRRYRKLCGFTQERLAEKVSTSTNYIGLIENGKKFPSLPMLERIATALEVDSIDLFAKTNAGLLQNKRLRKELKDEICAAVDGFFDAEY